MENIFTPMSLMLYIFFFAALIGASWFINRTKINIPSWSIIVILTVAAVLRLILMQKYPGYETDMGCFYSWGLRMAENGPGNFYAPDYFCDYPPGFMYLLWISGKITQLFNVNFYTGTGKIVVKLIPLIFDLLGIFIIWLIAKKQLGTKSAAILAAIYAFSPAVLIDGAIWGQADSVIVFGIVITLIFALKGSWHIALPVYVLTVLMKPQALIVGPIGLLAFILDSMPFKKKWKTTLKQAGIGLGISVLVAFAVLFPFLRGESAPFAWLIDKYASTIGFYDYATVNAANFHYLIGKNWIPLSGESGNTAYGIFGNILIVLSVAFPAVLYLIKKDKKLLPFYCALTYILLFIFGVKMHERYIFPALLLLLYAYVQKRDWRIIAIFCGISLTFFLNCAYVLQFTHLPLGFFWAGAIISLCNIFIGVFSVWTALDKDTMALESPGEAGEKTWKEENKRNEPSPAITSESLKNRLGGKTPPIPFGRLDVFAMLALTFLYGSIAFYNLGSFTAPQTVWKSAYEGEELVFDLGDSDAYEIMYYNEINWHDSNFTLDFSNDGVNYVNETSVVAKPGDCFRWQYISRDSTGRFVRLRAESEGLALMEIVFRDSGGNVISPKISGGENTLNLIDEGGTAPQNPGFFNGTYFDEIYHARTAYEHVNKMPAYETTHPPLGKIFIAAGIKMFGMTPFGWRFSGTVAGILMIPAMYMLGLVLFKKSKWAILTAFFTAFDIMHFAQTRIATIDSYAVLFIILMYACMFRYTQMSFYRDGYKTLIPLGASGIFMGLACASKWIGFYAAIGLAVLFFWTMYQRRQERRLAIGEGGVWNKKTQQYEGYAKKTIIFCVFFFGLIPLLIYYFSYLPHLAPSGGLNPVSFWKAQTSMLSYHSNLTDRHSFESPWYEWPLSLKPIWYYNDSHTPDGRVSSINSFGNIVVWWAGFAAFLYVAYKWARGFIEARLGKKPVAEDKRPAMLLIALASQFLPWVFISRSTFIYHYFASLIFIICSLVYCFELLAEKKPKIFKIALPATAALTVLMFFLHYPLASGLEVNRSYAEGVNFFKFLKLPGWSFRGWLWYG